jgi:hypothetical protein
MVIVIAEPVMNPAIEQAGIKSTRMPRRTRPINIAMAPVSKEKVTAISVAVMVALSEVTLVMVWPTNRDMTAVGPMEISFEVANRQ